MTRFSLVRYLASVGAIILPLFLVGEGDRERTNRSAGPADPTRTTPISFEANRGQAVESTRFLARGAGLRMRFSPTGTELLVPGDEAGTAWPLQISFRGADPQTTVEGFDELPGRVHYLVGRQPESWVTDVPTYSAVRYKDLYPGVDLVYRGRGRQLEAELTMAPGVDPDTITLLLDGVDTLEMDPRGDLLAHTTGASMRYRRPLIFQPDADGGQETAGRYLLVGERGVGLGVGEYDPEKPLVIRAVIEPLAAANSLTEPTRVGVAVDELGNTFVAGHLGAERGWNANALEQRSAELFELADAFVIRLEPGGSMVGYRTYFGGSGDDVPLDIAAGGAGQAIVAGRTGSPDFPTTLALQDELSGGSDAFVARLSDDGAGWVYSTLLGGDGDDAAHGIAVDGSGRSWIAGQTASSDFPAVMVEPDSRPAGRASGFVARLSADGSALARALPLDGLKADAIAVGPTGSVHITGGSGTDAFVATIDADDESSARVVHLGGSADEAGTGIAIDAESNIYVTGWTRSTDFPTTSGAMQSVSRGSIEGFLAKIAADDHTIVHSTYIGGREDDRPRDVVVGADGGPWMTGATDSTDLDSRDLFVMKLDPDDLAPTSWTRLGGEAEDGSAIAIAPDGRAVVAGTTRSGGSDSYQILEPTLFGEIFVSSPPPATLAAGCPGTINFDNDSADGLWQTASNWDTDSLPISTDDVCIGAFDVTLSSAINPTVASLTVEAAGSLTVTTGTLTLDTASQIDGALNQSGGTLTGAGDLTVSGLYTWTAGTFGGTGELNPQGGLNLTGGGTAFLYRTLNNTATTIYSPTGSGTLRLGTGGVFDNKVGATFDVQNDADLIRQSGTPVFINDGTFVKSGGTGITALPSNIIFANDGSVDVQTGTVELQRGATHTGSFDCTGGRLTFDGGNHTLSAAETLTGTDVLFDSGTIDLPGGYDVTGTTTIAGSTVNFTGSITDPGTLVLTSGTANFSNTEGEVTQSTFTMTAGTINGSSDFTVTGAMTWTAGTFGGTGELNPQGGLNLTGGGTAFLYRTLNNTATTIYNPTGSGTFRLGTGGVFDNKVGATFDAQNDADLVRQSGTPVFINDGAFVKSGGTGITVLPSNIIFANDGSVDVQTGTLELQQGATHTGSFDCTGGRLTFDGGNHTLSAAETLTGTDVLFDSGTIDLPGGYDVTGTTTIAGSTVNFTGSITDPGTLVLTSGTANFSNTEGEVTQSTFTMTAGTINGSSDFTVTGAMTWTAGTFGGTGELNPQGGLNLTGGGTAFLYRTLNNTATTIYNPTGSGTFRLGTGGVFDNKVGATFDAQNDADLVRQSGTPVFINDGAFVKSGGTGITVLPSNIIFANDGSVDVQTGTLELQQGATHTGSFDCTGGRLTFDGGNHTLSAAETLTGTDVLFDSGTIDLPGGYDVTGTTTIAGSTVNFTGSITDPGTLVLTSGTANFSNTEGEVTQSTFTMTAGTINGSSDFTVTGAMTWTAGTFGGTGELNPQGGLNLTGGGTAFLYRTLNNTATTIYNPTGSGTFRLGTGGVFDNKVGATFDAQNDADLVRQSGTPVFINDGAFVKSGGTGITVLPSNIIFANDGSVDVQTGTLELQQGATHTGSFDCTGGRLTFDGGNHTLSAAETLTGTDVLFDSGTIDLPGGYDVTGTTTIAGSTVNFTGSVTDLGTLVLTSGTANFSNTEGEVTQSTFTMTAGTINGSSDFTVTGAMTWTAGTFGGTGELNPQGGLNLTGGGTAFLYRTLNNTATTIYNPTGSGTFRLGTGGVFDNKVGATFDAQNDADLVRQSGTPVFINDGAFVKSGGTGITVLPSNIIFANDGSVDVQTGTLELQQGATHTGSFDCTGGRLTFDGGNHTLSAAETLTGTDVLFDSGTIDLPGGYDVTGTTTIAGSTVNFTGSVTNLGNLIISSGTANFSNTEGTVTPASFTQTSGTVSGSSDLNVTTLAEWSSGTHSGTGQTNFQAGVTLSGGGSTTLTRTMTNSGNAVLSGTGAFRMGTDGIFNNLSGGTFDVQSDADFIRSAGSPVVNNAGTFRKSAGAATTSFSSSLPFTNTGAVEALSGTLSFVNYTQTAGSTTVNGGVLDGTGPTFDIQGGLVAGVGTISAPVDSTAGQVAPGLSAAGVLAIDDDYTQQAAGSFQVELSGVGCTDSDRLDVTDTATLDGTLDVTLVDGCMPIPGQSFTLITANLVSGTFLNFTPPATDCPVDWTVVYNAGSVVLDVSTGTCLDGDGDTFSDCCGTCNPDVGDFCTDCDDADPVTFPGAPELCDGTDNDCDTTVPGDEIDDDGDLYVECTGWNDTQGDAPTILGGDDCDDADPVSFPGSPEVCDGNDNDCDSTVPGGEIDDDGDLYVECSGWDDTQGDQPTILGSGDCDDADAASFPSNPELCDGNDNDCDSLVPADELDDDTDLYVECSGWSDSQGDQPTILGGADCDDTDVNSFPGGAELCDGNDNDCDTIVPADEADDDTDLYVECSGWSDTQGDQAAILGGADCDDTDANSFPGGPELCDGNDNDCDTIVPADEADDDTDLYVECSGWSDTQGDQAAILGGADCDDTDANSFPGGAELCDGNDNDCDTIVPADEADDDTDLYVECSGWSDTQGDQAAILGGADCDDTDANSFPGGPELCDGNDNDCDTIVPADEADDDTDLYVECSGWSDTQGDQAAILGGADCDDTDANSFPGGAELCDGNDNNCDTVVPADEFDDDTDLYVECPDWSDTQGDQAAILGGADCDDIDVTSFPGGAELCDGNDNDCDTTVPADEVDSDGDLYVACVIWTDTQGDQPAILGGNDCAPGNPLINPGAIEVCDGLDNDCSSVPDDGDGDSDGFLVCADCDDSNGLIHAIPTEALNLRFTLPTNVQWDPPLDPGGSVVDYDTIRSADPGDFLTAPFCVESDDGSDTEATEPDVPVSGAVFYYLARAENGCGLGSVGTGWDGVAPTPRAAGVCP